MVSAILGIRIPVNIKFTLIDCIKIYVCNAFVRGKILCHFMSGIVPVSGRWSAYKNKLRPILFTKFNYTVGVPVNRSADTCTMLLVLVHIIKIGRCLDPIIKVEALVLRHLLWCLSAHNLPCIMKPHSASRYHV